MESESTPETTNPAVAPNSEPNLERQLKDQEKQLADMRNVAQTQAQQITDLENAAQTQAQQLQMQSEQMRARLQNTLNAAISTRGQIVVLQENLKEQERDAHRLEGALDVVQALMVG